MEVSGKLYIPDGLIQNHGAHQTKGWVDSTAGLEDFGEEKISCSCRNSNPGPPK